MGGISGAEKPSLTPAELAWDLLFLRMRFMGSYRNAGGVLDDVALKGMAVSVALAELRKEGHFTDNPEKERATLNEAHRINPGFY